MPDKMFGVNEFCKDTSQKNYWYKIVEALNDPDLSTAIDHHRMHREVTMHGETLVSHLDHGWKLDETNKETFQRMYANQAMAGRNHRHDIAVPVSKIVPHIVHDALPADLQGYKEFCETHSQENYWRTICHDLDDPNKSKSVTSDRFHRSVTKDGATLEAWHVSTTTSHDWKLDPANAEIFRGMHHAHTKARGTKHEAKDAIGHPKTKDREWVGFNALTRARTKVADWICAQLTQAYEAAPPSENGVQTLEYRGMSFTVGKFGKHVSTYYLDSADKRKIDHLYHNPQVRSEYESMESARKKTIAL